MNLVKCLKVKIKEKDCIKIDIFDTCNNNEDKTNNKDNKDEVETKTEIKKQYRNI